MADKIWIVCKLCAGNGTIKDAEFGQPEEIITCPRCNGEKVEVTGVVEGTAEDARGVFGL